MKYYAFEKPAQCEPDKPILDWNHEHFLNISAIFGRQSRM